MTMMVTYELTKRWCADKLRDFWVNFSINFFALIYTFQSKTKKMLWDCASEWERSRKIDNHDGTRSNQHVSREFHDVWKKGYFQFLFAVTHATTNEVTTRSIKLDFSYAIYCTPFQFHVCYKYSDFLFYSLAFNLGDFQFFKN